MKNSGIEWIGEIPDSWQLIKIGSIFACRNEKVSDSEFSPLSVSRGGVVPQMENVAKSDAGDNRKLVLKNDFVINSRSDRKQSCGVSSLDGSVSLINTVLYPIAANVIIPEYANVVMKNYGFAEEFYRWGHGIVADLWTTRWQEMKSIVLPLPTIDTQVCIIKDLSQKLTEVDKLIEVQQAQIEKLKEYKQSVITEAVTKGLDPTAPMKDSGVEWIGKIPDSWKVMRLKDAIESHFGGCWGEEASEDGGILCIRIADFDFDRQTIKSSASTKRQYSTAQLEKGLLQDGDLILEKSGGGEKTSVGRIVVFEQKMFPSKAMFANFSECLRVKRELHNEKYCAYLLKALYCTKDMSCFYHQTTGIQNLDIAEYLSMNLCFPSRNEQDFIVACLDKKLVEIDKLIALKQSKIEKLQEYKKSLIYEYVTGKKEVM